MRVQHAAATALLLGAAACTHDFDAFQAGADAGHADSAVNDGATDTANDTASADTIGIDTTPCVPQPSCLVDAQSCAAPCDAAESSCIAACGNPGCKNKCTDTANACRADCVTACVTCTTSAGCAASADCTAAAK